MCWQLKGIIQCEVLPINLDHVVPDELHWSYALWMFCLRVLQVVQLDVKVNKKQADPAMLQLWRASRRVVYHFRFGERTLVHLHWIGHH